MVRRVRVSGKAQVHARHLVTGGCDTEKNFIVAAIYHAETGSLEAQEFRQYQVDALRAAEWFLSQKVELVVLKALPITIYSITTLFVNRGSILP